METPKQPPKRRRARKSDGTFKGDNPATTTNEAWEATEISAKPEGKYEVKPKVNGISGAGAGKYSKKPKLRPTFGNVTTTTF